MALPQLCFLSWANFMGCWHGGHCAGTPQHCKCLSKLKGRYKADRAMRALGQGEPQKIQYENSIIEILLQQKKLALYKTRGDHGFKDSGPSFQLV